MQLEYTALTGTGKMLPVSWFCHTGVPLQVSAFLLPPSVVSPVDLYWQDFAELAFRHLLFLFPISQQLAIHPPFAHRDIFL